MGVLALVLGAAAGVAGRGVEVVDELAADAAGLEAHCRVERRPGDEVGRTPPTSGVLGASMSRCAIDAIARARRRPIGSRCRPPLSLLARCDFRRGCCAAPPTSGSSPPCGAVTRAAFEAIYDRHHRALLGFCRHMLGSHEEAEDALQRVFVSAHGHLRDGTAHVNLKPWLYTIARNRCLSMLRARRETLALDDVHEPSSDGLALADEVELGEDLKDLLGDIARLPDDQRAALVLAELGDLSQQEIAATLDVRTDKVKALIFQAREALAGWRQAREVSCREICEQLSTLKGSALRRAPDPPPPRGLPGVHGLRGRGQAPARRALAAAPGGPERRAQAQRAHRRALRRRPGRRGGGGRRGRRPGSPPRPWWSPPSRSAQAGAAWSPCASSSSPGRSSAPRRRRARPWPPPWRRRSASPRRLGVPAPRRARRDDRLAGPEDRRAVKDKSKARKARGRGRQQSARALRPGPAAGGGTRRPGPAAGGGCEAGPRRDGPRPAPAAPRRPPPPSPRRASARRRRRPPRTARPADRPTFVAAPRLKGHEDSHHTLADRRTRPQHHRIRGHFDSCADHPVGFEAVPHRAFGDGPRALSHDLRHEQDQAQRVRQVRRQAHARDHRGRQGGQAERLQGLHRRGDRRSGRLHREVRHRQARRQRARQVRVAEGEVQGRQDRRRTRSRPTSTPRRRARPSARPTRRHSPPSTAPARTSATPSASASPSRPRRTTPRTTRTGAASPRRRPRVGQDAAWSRPTLSRLTPSTARAQPCGDRDAGGMWRRTPAASPA